MYISALESFSVIQYVHTVRITGLSIFASSGSDACFSPEAHTGG